MPHTDRFLLATKFVAVKQHYATLHKQQSQAALLKLGNRGTQGAENVLSATSTSASSGHVGTPLAHMDLDTFIRTNEVNGVDALVMTRDLARGLAALHAAGFVHGDVQTKSMLVGPGGYLVGDIDGLREGDERDLRPGNYSRSSDVEDLHFVLSEIYKNAVSATVAGSLDAAHGTRLPSDRQPENKDDLLTQIGAELVKRGRDAERTWHAVASFAQSLSQLKHGIDDEAALEGLASKADELIRALQAAPSVH
jgi:hypothetical protein